MDNLKETILQYSLDETEFDHQDSQATNILIPASPYSPWLRQDFLKDTPNLKIVGYLSDQETW